MSGARKIVVTGGAGFIGSHLTDALIASGHEVVVIDDLSSGKTENLNPAARLVRGDVRDTGLLAEAVQGAGAVFHLAAIASVQKYFDDLHEAHAINLGGLVSVIQACRLSAPEAVIVQASSAAVYGDSTDLPLRESATLSPISFYGLDKALGEDHARLACSSFGMRIACLRFFNVYGARQDPASPYSGVISAFIGRMLRGEPVMIYGDGEQTRDFINVADVVDALMLAEGRFTCSEKGAFGAFNVCTGTRASINALYSELAAVTGINTSPAYAPAKPGDIRQSVGSPDLAASELGFVARRDFGAGLAGVVDDVRRRGA